jgi:pyruvate dehydrogenase E1 component alpha subunit
MSIAIKETLINFEEKIASHFNNGLIRAPVHLYFGNEDEIIKIFKEIKSVDWVFASWRSHYQCLLKGVPETILENAILDGRSIALCFPEYHIFSSAIVGGQVSIAVGTAMAIKKSDSSEHVWCFVGDMTSETGIFQTSVRFSHSQNLPITFVVEDNGASVMTDTRQTWNVEHLRYEEINFPNVISYKYKSKYPHAGAGKRVQF